MTKIVGLASVFLSFALGSLCILLLSLSHQQEISLILITCSSFLYGLVLLVTLLIRVPFEKVIRGTVDYILQLITLGSSVAFFSNLIKQENISTSLLQKRVLIATGSILLFSLFCNGYFIGMESTATSPSKETLHDAEQNIPEYTEKNRFVPVKNSSQTLTPDMDIQEQNYNEIENKINWLMDDLPQNAYSDQMSNRSVIHHELKRVTSLRNSSAQKNARSIKAPSSKRRKNKLASIKQKFGFTQSIVTKKNASNSNKVNNSNKGRLVVSIRDSEKLFRTSDLTKRISNMTFSNSAIGFDNLLNSVAETSRSEVLNTSHLASVEKLSEQLMVASPALIQERSAIERINSALLPPCLRLTETSRQPSFDVEDEPQLGNQINDLNDRFDSEQKSNCATNVLDNNNLRQISEIIDLNFDHTSLYSAEHVEFPPNVTLEMWRKDKESFLKREESINREALLPPFKFDLGKALAYSANDDSPLSSPVETDRKLHLDLNQKIISNDRRDISAIIKLVERSNEDAISQLDKFLNEFSLEEGTENQCLEESLSHKNSMSVISDDATRDTITGVRAHHSPSKSIASIISGNESFTKKSQHALNSILKHSRTNSQVTYTFPSSTNFGRSVHSSPTKSQRIKRMGKKLSLSSITDAVSSSFSQEFTTPLGSRSHNRGKSVDFSYLHSIQNNSSPIKTISREHSLRDNRRHSLAPSILLRDTARSSIYLHSNATVHPNQEVAFDVTLNNNSFNEPQDQSRSVSHPDSIESTESANMYPDIVMSEYDREKWNTMRTLNIIDSKGQIKI
ncbi:hypothetical protein KAFR_0A00850 [Kazachstania africana CBS 2517]|uniref:Uncharacterized protein n=1 Tax=Kazachstania africana (strain ATCC 22294 / BCRC 22015 / CBS 2517 / CECT 1963 / NBRC 1671 / NRRL Y-8276) TaxID=1071382 RepID=H2AMC3_KAZAF|nr:hypothetical protein KAFR_0A00850 [Kazachstania africana CBS 2517]CCF55523.1 hypothetical protein KAFR_0A00850 [Kazachstania africana CBS 2517]